MEQITKEPELLVEERQKTKSWLEEHIKYYSQVSNANANQKTNDITCWQYYNNKTEVAKFEYLTSMGNYHLPSQIRHIPLQRTNCDILTSQKLYRPFVYDILVADRASMEEKYQFKIQGITNIIMNATERKNHTQMAELEKIDAQFQKIAQVLQQQPQQPQQPTQDMSSEQQQQLMEANAQLQQQQQVLQEVMPDLKHQFDYMKEALQDKIEFTERELGEIKLFNTNKKKDIKEIVAFNVSKELRRTLKIANESNKSFLSDVVTGRTAFYVDIEENTRKPVFRALNIMKVYYPSVDGIEWIQDGPWVKIEDGISFQQLVSLYGEEFKTKYSTADLNKLQDRDSIQNGTFTAVPGGGAVLVDELYSGSSVQSSAITRERIWFKVPRKIYVKYSPNPWVQGEYFRKFLDADKIVIDEEEYKYSKEDGGYYINKKNEEIVYRKEQVEKFNKSKGDDLKIYYTNDIYQGVVLNREYVVGVKKKLKVLRNPDRHSDVQLPVYGRTHAAINDQPYSIIKDTINLQDMYDLINYYRDLMFALSGPKTILYDRSYKPTTMTDDEWEYQKKIGTIHIQSTDAYGNPNRSQFNQMTMWDMTISSSVQYFDGILESIKETMGEIVGVPRQRKGQIVESDQVGTMEMSLKQAALITELRFYKHDEIEAKAFEACVNYALKYCIREDDIINVIGRDFSSDLIKVPKGIFDDVRIEAVIANNGEQQTLMGKLEDLAMIGFKSGTISYDGIVKTFVGSTNLTEFKKSVEHFTEEAKKMQQQMAGADEQQKAKLQEQAEKMRQEFEGFWKQKDYEAKQIGNRILDENNKVQAQIMAERNAIEREKLEKESALKMLDLTSRDTSEKALLEENKEARVINNELEAMKMKIELILSTLQLNLDKVKHDKDHKYDMKSLDVDLQKNKKKVMEQVAR